MNTSRMKCRAARAARKLSAATACGLLAALTLGARAAAQDCPNARTFGERPVEARLWGEARSVQVRAVYFSTEDKNALIPEVEGRRWNAASVTFSTEEFRGKLARLVARGEAAVNGRWHGALPLGDTAALDRGRESLYRDASVKEFARPVLDVAQALALDRYTTFSVVHRPGEPFYRVHLLSWFVGVRPDGSGWMTVDFDCGTFLRHGQTQVLKFMSDFEVQRTGNARSYLALSLIPSADGDESEGAHGGD